MRLSYSFTTKLLVEICGIVTFSAAHKRKPNDKNNAEKRVGCNLAQNSVFSEQIPVQMIALFFLTWFFILIVVAFSQ